MSLRHLIKYGLSLPPHVALSKALQMVGKRAVGKWRATLGAQTSTYTNPVPTPITSLHRLTSNLPSSCFDTTDNKSGPLSAKYMAHEFNLLGSGWTDLGLASSDSQTPVSSGNRARSDQIRSLISKDNAPIDWQLDFRSGYRWPASQRSEAIAYGHEPGVDIKVPWELARLQHLAQLALAYGTAKRGAKGFAAAEDYRQAFKNQTLDFISANPPQYGVNWACTMDVALRAANLIMAFDLFRAGQAEFEPEFVDEFTAAIRAHGAHITSHLEWHEGFRGNHYLADITGLLFIAAFLPRNSEVDCWLAFAVQEFTREINIQFEADGSNAEASTNYHRLSAEMAVYGTALIVGLGGDKQKALQDYNSEDWQHQPGLQSGPIDWQKNLGTFTENHFNVLRKAAQFSIDVTKPDGSVVQIGDTDNGRLFKFCPAIANQNLDEAPLDHGHLAAAFAGLFDDALLQNSVSAAYQPEAIIVKALRGEAKPPMGSWLPSQIISRPADVFETSPSTAAQRLIIELPTSALLEGLVGVAYPDFGLYIWRSERFFLSVRCGPVGQAGNGGHAHNDQLAIELQVDGEDWVADPGTFTYTADTVKRDQYRSHLAHAGPRLSTKEPSRLNLGLFRLEDNCKAQCLTFNETEFLGLHSGYSEPTFRRVKLNGSQIEITDCLGAPPPADLSGAATIVRSAEELQNHFELILAFSPGYGMLTPSKS